jgi:xanthine/CO dehydrogenase XdhC/CoxF family maturation factor
MDDATPFALEWNLIPGPPHAPSLIDQAPAIPIDGRFCETLTPPPNLIIAGAGDDSIPLAALAAEAGFRVTVVDHRSGYLMPQRFPGATLVHARPDTANGALPLTPRTLIVIKNHALTMDRQWAEYFAALPHAYLGLLGPKKRCAQVAENLPPHLAPTTFGPAGLDLGSEGAEQIAISIVAELLAVTADRTPTHLRHRKGSIHG